MTGLGLGLVLLIAAARLGDQAGVALFAGRRHALVNRIQLVIFRTLIESWMN